MRTGIPGLYAAGDCTGGLLQICKAVYEGALAATEAIGALRRSKQSIGTINKSAAAVDGTAAVLLLY